MTDARLLLPAGAAWGGALLGGFTGEAVAHAMPARVLVAAAGAGLLTAAVASSRTTRATAFLAGGCLLAGVLAGWLQAAALRADPVASWAGQRVTATVDAVVVGEPRRRLQHGPAWASRSRSEVRIATSRVAARGVTLDVDLPMLAQMPYGAVIPAPGTRIRVSGRLGPGLVSSGMAATITASSIEVLASPGPLDLWAHASRIGLRDALDGTDPEAGALVAGLAVGDESLESAALATAMRSSGLAHLTAVSGANVAIVVVTVVAVATIMGLSLLSRAVAALVALALFVVLVGPQPSVLRAAVMGAVVLTGLLVGGRRAGPSVLAASVLVLVIISPTLALSWAFALSVGATAGLILLAPSLRSAIDSWPRAGRWPPGMRDAIAVTTAAQLATLPLLVLMGASTGWVALPANLLAMPAVPAVTVLGLAAAIVAPVLPLLAHLLAVAASWPAGWIALVAEVGSSLPLAVLPWPSGPMGVLLLAALGGAAWLGRRWARHAFPNGIPRSVVVVGLSIVLPTATLWLVVPPDRRSWPPANWILIMCDVGQGDGLLLRAGEAAAVVVDAGPDPDRIDDCLADAGIQQIPAVLLTHFHADHVDGLSGVLRGRDVAAVYVSPVADPAERAVAVDGLLAAAGLHPIPLAAGDEQQVGDLHWRVLWPRRVITTGSIPNNASAVLVVQIAGRTLLLTGDIERLAQSAILPDLVGLHFDVVKVPHHGSRDQDPRLAPATSPAVTLISVGAGNTYGHPSDETIAAWQSVGALVARTDRDGDVAVVTTAAGVGLTVRAGRLPP